MYFHVSIIFAVCACAAVAADEPRLTPADVRQMADAEARQQGYDLEVYTRGEPSYDPVSKTWGVNYRLKSSQSASSSHGVLSVDVSDTTGFISTRLWLATPTPAPPTSPASVTDSEDLILLLLGLTCSLVLVGLLFFQRSRVYAPWAKVASILSLITAAAWAAMGFVLIYWRSYHLTRDFYNTFLGLKGILGGIAIGLALSILMARPYTKKHTERLSV